MKLYRPNAVQTVLALCIGVVLLTGVAAAQDAPSRLPAASAAAGGTANTYITQLDGLRALSQVAGTRRPTANDYTTTLDHLRSMAAASRK